jgi:hypothetical protein
MLWCSPMYTQLIAGGRASSCLCLTVRLMTVVPNWRTLKIVSRHETASGLRHSFRSFRHVCSALGLQRTPGAPGKGLQKHANVWLEVDALKHFPDVLVMAAIQSHGVIEVHRSVQCMCSDNLTLADGTVSPGSNLQGFSHSAPTGKASCGAELAHLYNVMNCVQTIRLDRPRATVRSCLFCTGCMMQSTHR